MGRRLPRWHVGIDGHYVLTGDHPVHVWVVGGNHRTRRVLVTAVLLEPVDAGTEVLEALNELNAATDPGTTVGGSRAEAVSAGGYL